jgi:hypothetical protein
LGATKNQLMSWFLGPLPWIGSWIRSVWRLRISFQGSPSRDSPCIRSLAKRAFNYALGSMIPRPPHEKGSVKESHLTFARVLDVFPPQMKLHITPIIWLHILGLGFQQVASTTWMKAGPIWLLGFCLGRRGCNYPKRSFCL